MMAGCQDNEKVMYESLDDYPVRNGSLSEMEYAPNGTSFHLWSPNADEVRLRFYYDNGQTIDLPLNSPDLEYWKKQLLQ